MAHHHKFSKRSRESRKARSGGAGDHTDYPDATEDPAEFWSREDEECDLPPDRAN